MDPVNTNPNENQMPVMPEMPTPVNPVINPMASAAMPEAPVAPAASAAPETPVVTGASVAPGASVAAPITPEAVAMPVMPGAIEPEASVTAPDSVMVGATDPITMPNLPKTPDPIEEELKAPMQAAAPVPGSIGSAISMPAEGGAATVSAAVRPMAQQPSVAFNDPAAAQQNPVPVQTKKKMDKKTLILLCAIAGIVVIGLAVVLIMQMM